MFKKISLLISFLFLALAFLLNTTASSAQEKPTVHFFWGKSCPHCAKEKVFLETLKEKYPQVEFKDYEIYYNLENQKKMIEMGKALSIDVPGVPFTVIGEKYFVGYLNDETTGREIEGAIVDILENRKVPEENSALKTPAPTTLPVSDITPIEKPAKTISLPLFGIVNLESLSLPLLTFVVALLDGFNPCAMWTLVFLISLLLGMEDRKRMWLLGITFIATSSFVYFLFLSAWLNFFLLVGFALWIRIVIGILALGAGGYYLKDYFKNKDASCKVTGGEKRQKVFEKLKMITQRRNLAWAILGIILLAFAVNLVELVCSAGLPAIYTQILSLSNLPKFEYYLYLLFYIFIFMLDDLFVFVAAMVTLKATGVHGKYSRYSHLIGGILMLVIGILLLFKPEVLMFN